MWDAHPVQWDHRSLQLLIDPLYLCHPQLSEQVTTLLPKVPIGLHEAAVRLVNRDSRHRPTAQLLAHIKFFKYVQCLGYFLPPVS